MHSSEKNPFAKNTKLSLCSAAQERYATSICEKKESKGLKQKFSRSFVINSQDQKSVIVWCEIIPFLKETIKHQQIGFFIHDRS